MKILQINTFSYKATGSIMMNIHQSLLKEGYQSYVVWGRGRKVVDKNEYQIGCTLDVLAHGVLSRLTDKTGFYSKGVTKKLIKYIDEVAPDIIHLHNIHGYYLNVEILFDYIKMKKIKVIWTLHDCWPFTGHCAYFDLHNCDKWKTGCHHCSAIHEYPKSLLFDNSAENWIRKKQSFQYSDLTIITPSAWLANVTKNSFFHDTDIKVINNGIDLEVFRKIILNKNEIRNQYRLSNKPCILGVAHEWTERKGLKDFLELSEKISNHYQILLVGLTEKQIASLPNRIIGVKATKSKEDLVKLYNYADIYYNPTYEDNFPTTNLEAIACGTPLLTYNTGGSPEAIEHGEKAFGVKVGYVLNKKTVNTVNLDEVCKTIEEMVNMKNSLSFNNACCLVSKLFDKDTFSRKYIEVYRNVCKQ